MTRKGSGTWDTGDPGLPLVAIVGRPNVGKSTLFNRLVGLRKAIVEDTPGVTRDTNLGEAEWGASRFLVMDTGGLEVASAAKGLSEKVRGQIRKAVHDADVLLFVVDGKVAVHPQDLEVLRVLRKTEKPILCAVNKIDTNAHHENVYPYYRLGLEPLFPISAEHGIGVGDLLDAVADRLPAPEPEGRSMKTAEPIKVAVLGRLRFRQR